MHIEKLQKCACAHPTKESTEAREDRCAAHACLSVIKNVMEGFTFKAEMGRMLCAHRARCRMLWNDKNPAPESPPSSNDDATKADKQAILELWAKLEKACRAKPVIERLKVAQNSLLVHCWLQGAVPSVSLTIINTSSLTSQMQQTISWRSIRSVFTLLR